MRRSDPIHNLLGTLYSAPLQPEMWSEFLSRLCALSGITKAAFLAHNVPAKDHRILAYVGDSVKESIPPYEKLYYQFDEWTSRFAARGGSGRLMQGEEIWPDDSLHKSVFYNEFLKKFDVCQMAGFVARGESGVFEALSVYRSPREERFDADSLTTLHVVIPHLQTALYTRRKILALESRISDLETALDRLDSALVLLDATGRAVFVNKSARQILDQRNGLSLQKGRIVARGVQDGAILREMLNKAIAAGTGKSMTTAGTATISRIGKMPLQIVAGPFSSVSSTVPVGAVAIVFLIDPERRPAPLPELLHCLFGFTAAESRLALVLMDGNSLQEAAEKIGVGRETVRSQIKSMFQKTGARRQGELFRVLSSLPSLGVSGSA